MKCMCEKFAEILDAHKLFLTFNENKKPRKVNAVQLINIMKFNFKSDNQNKI